MKKFLPLILVLALLSSGCQPSDTTQSDSDQPVKVGVLIPMTSMFAQFGQLVQQGLLAGVGDGIELVWEDSGCDPVKALSGWRKLHDMDGIDLFIGPACGAPQEVLAPVVQDRNVAMLLISTPTEQVHTASAGKMLAAQTSIEAEDRFLAQEMSELGHEKVVLIFDENDFGRAHEAGFREVWPGEVVATLTTLMDSADSLRPLVTKLRQLDFDAVLVPDASPFFLGLMTEMRKLGLEQPVFSIFSAENQSVLDNEGEAAEGLIYSYPDTNGEESLQYFAQLSAVMMTQAVAACGDDPDCVLTWLQDNFDFTEHGVHQTPMILKTVRDGQFVPLDQ